MAATSGTILWRQAISWTIVDPRRHMAMQSLWRSIRRFPHVDIAPHSACLHSGGDVTINCPTPVMKLQLTCNCDARTWKVKSNSLQIDFIHDDIHDRSCKKEWFLFRTWRLCGERWLRGSQLVWSALTIVVDFSIVNWNKRRNWQWICRWIRCLSCNNSFWMFWCFACSRKQTRVVTMPTLLLSFWQPGPRLNIKTVLSTYGDFHVKDKTAVRTSYL